MTKFDCNHLFSFEVIKGFVKIHEVTPFYLTYNFLRDVNSKIFVVNWLSLKFSSSKVKILLAKFLLASIGE